MDQRQSWMVAAKFEKRALLIAVNVVAGIAICFFGNDGGVNSSPDYARTMGFGHANAQGSVVVTHTLLQGGIVSIYYLGTLIGCLHGGWIGDKYGRIKGIALGSVWGILGASLQCSAQNSGWMIGARLVNGIAEPCSHRRRHGILNAIVPAWGSEIAEYKSRGQFIAIEFTLNIFGVVIAYWLEYGVSFINGGKSPFRWRIPIGFQIIFLILLVLICWAFPESHRWLSKVGRNDEALYILQRLRGTTGEDAGKAEAELKDIRNVVELESKTAHQNSYFHMLFGIGSGKLHTGRRVQLVVWLQIFQDWTGIAGITMFGPSSEVVEK